MLWSIRRRFGEVIAPILSGVQNRHRLKIKDGGQKPEVVIYLAQKLLGIKFQRLLLCFSQSHMALVLAMRRPMTYADSLQVR